MKRGETQNLLLRLLSRGARLGALFLDGLGMLRDHLRHVSRRHLDLRHRWWFLHLLLRRRRVYLDYDGLTAHLRELFGVRIQRYVKWVIVCRGALSGQSWPRRLFFGFFNFGSRLLGHRCLRLGLLLLLLLYLRSFSIALDRFELCRLVLILLLI